MHGTEVDVEDMDKREIEDEHEKILGGTPDDA